VLLSVRLLHLFQLSEARHEFLVSLLQSFLFCHKAFVFYSNVIDVVRSALKNQHLGRFVIVTEFGNLNAKSLERHLQIGSSLSLENVVLRALDGI